MKGSFLSGRALRQSRVASGAAKGSMVVNAVAVNPSERPLWFPGSTPPEWLDGRSV